MQKINISIFSDKIENTGRQTELDLARGFSSLLIIICHVGLYLGTITNAGLWTFCDIIGSEWGAPVFMVLMGIGVVYSRRVKPGDMAKRGLMFFLLGYILSFFRSILPLIILGPIDEWASVDAFFVVDIMQFAGLAYLFIAFLKKIKFSSLAIFMVSVAMVIINQFIMLPESVPWQSSWLTYIVNLFCPITSWSCFPFLTWFIFPAFGLLFGDLLRRCTNKKKLYGALFAIGLLGMLYVYYQFYLLYPEYTAYYWGNNFYYMGIKNVLFTILFVLFEFSFCFVLEKILPVVIKKIFSFLSRNLNVYYFISWILIIVLISAKALCNWSFNSLALLVIMLVLTFLCMLLTKFWLIAKEKYFCKKHSK